MRAAVLGSPIAHSLSPALHRAAYALIGLDWTYEAVECDAAALPGFVAALTPQWAGLSLTRPCKVAVVDLLDEFDEWTRLTGAANTLVLRDGRRLGANTDVSGLVGALAEAGVHRGGAARATVLGAGATARSAVVSLAAAGYPGVDVAARRPQATAELAATADAVGIDVRVHPWTAAASLLGADLVVCTVPMGAADELAATLGPGGPQALQTLFDVVYDPWPTVLATAWAARGGRVLSGLDLLVHQAVGQVQLMTGCSVQPGQLVAVMRAAGMAALSAR